MPDLVNLLDHMKGKSVYVNGTTYAIDEEGIVRDVEETDAAKLLGNPKHWMEYDPEAAAKREERRKALREDFKMQRGGIQLIGKDGQVIDPKAEAEAAAKKKKAEEEAKAQEAVPPPAEDLPSMQSEAPPEMPAPPPVDIPPEPADPGPPGAQGGPEPEPQQAAGEEAEDEWPDPHMGMSKTQLHEIADAYDLQYNGKTTKQQLVDIIMEAMYAQP